jgi:hypothetical protein
MARLASAATPIATSARSTRRETNDEVAPQRSPHGDPIRQLARVLHLIARSDHRRAEI